MKRKLSKTLFGTIIYNSQFIYKWKKDNQKEILTLRQNGLTYINDDKAMESKEEIKNSIKLKLNTFHNNYFIIETVIVLYTF
jgi:hypothetical protein